jgi:RNA polymerase sigma factor (sigma-70 family)
MLFALATRVTKNSPGEREAMDLNTCYAHVAVLDAEYQWHLSPAQSEEYASFLASAASAATDNPAVLLSNYHADHRVVDALQDPGHPEHNEQWAIMRELIRKMVYKWQFSAIKDKSLEPDDLVQTAASAIARGITRFQYRSSLTTWIAQVALNVIRLAHRHGNTKGRKGDQVELTDTLADSTQIDQELGYTQLYAEIDTLLRTQGDLRLALVFRLYYVEHLKQAEIAKQLGLSIGRVSMLLKDARTLLYNDVSLRQQASDAGIIFDETHDN